MLPDAPTLRLDTPALERLFRIWGIPLPEPGRLALVGFRGAIPVEAPRGWRRQWSLRLAPPNYRRMGCALGIWDRGAGRLYLARASTVPHRDQVLAAARKGGKGANQLEPGYYTDLRKGEHLQGKPRGHSALRQTARRFYRRSPHPPPITGADRLYWGNPYDNLHCGWNLTGATPGYASAGCMVVAGLPYCPRLDPPGRDRGPWKVFHDILYAVPQADFPLLLLPARAAADSLKPAAAGRPRFCFGSQGPAVRQLQARLRRAGLYRGALSGRMDTRTYRAWERFRRRG